MPTTQPNPTATLHDFKTGNILRAATSQEVEESAAAAMSDGNFGSITVDGASCFVRMADGTVPRLAHAF